MSGTGEPVMCAVILKSNKDISEIPLSWKMGIDIRKEVNTGQTQYELFEGNMTDKGAMAGGPKCTYNGKTIPCFFGASSKASITSEMLAKMLETIDTFGIYDRSTGCRPVLLLDGHHSRLKLLFLEYINDVTHPWVVCIGVPYGTHLWQVGDAPELNGTYKILLANNKREYLKYKTTDEEIKWSHTDIIPLVNMTWPKSFAQAEYAKRAISKRGWNPLTYNLLDRPRLLQQAKITYVNLLLLQVMVRRFLSLPTQLPPRQPEMKLLQQW
jgi:hypothetical protein